MQVEDISIFLWFSLYYFAVDLVNLAKLFFFINQFHFEVLRKRHKGTSVLWLTIFKKKQIIVAVLHKKMFCRYYDNETKLFELVLKIRYVCKAKAAYTCCKNHRICPYSYFSARPQTSI